MRLTAEIQYAGKSKNVNTSKIIYGMYLRRFRVWHPHLSGPPKAIVDRRVQVKIEKEFSNYGMPKCQKSNSHVALNL